MINSKSLNQNNRILFSGCILTCLLCSLVIYFPSRRLFYYHWHSNLI